MARRTHLKVKSEKRETAPVVVVKRGVNDLHPLARATALNLAHGDATRVEVISEREAIIH